MAQSKGKCHTCIQNFSEETVGSLNVLHGGAVPPSVLELELALRHRHLDRLRDGQENARVVPRHLPLPFVERSQLRLQRDLSALCVAHHIGFLGIRGNTPVCNEEYSGSVLILSNLMGGGNNQHAFLYPHKIKRLLKVTDK